MSDNERHLWGVMTMLLIIILLVLLWPYRLSLGW